MTFTPPDHAGAVSQDEFAGRVKSLRALAAHLVRHSADEDDLVQEALVAEWKASGHSEAPPLVWTQRVLRNLAVDHFRRVERVRSAETLATENRAASDSPDRESTALEKTELHRDVVNALLALDEPYRQCLVQRYFEGDSPRQIARKEGATVPAIKKRLERGLQKLRISLERSHGKGTWAVALLPLVKARSTMGMTARVTCIASASVLMGVGALILASETPREGGARGEPAEVITLAMPASPIERPATVESEMVPPEDARSTAARTELSAEPEHWLTARFLDPDGNPVEGARAQALSVGSGLAVTLGEAQSSAKGDITLPFRDAAGPFIVTVEKKGFATFSFQNMSPDLPIAFDAGDVTMFKEATARVRIVDRDGEPIHMAWEAKCFFTPDRKQLYMSSAEADASTDMAVLNNLPATFVEIEGHLDLARRLSLEDVELTSEGINELTLVYGGPDLRERIVVRPKFPRMLRRSSIGEVDLGLIHKGEEVQRITVHPMWEWGHFDGVGTGPHHVRILDDRWTCDPVPVKRGESCTLTVSTAAALSLEVRDASGTRRDDYRLSFRANDGSVGMSNGTWAELRRSGEAEPEGGTYRNLVPEWPFSLLVECEGGESAIVDVAALGRDEVRTLAVTLGAGRTKVPVGVRRASGGALPEGVLVGIFDGTEEPGPVDVGLAVQLLQGTRSSRKLRLLDQAMTNAQGEAALTIAASDTGLSLLAVAYDAALGVYASADVIELKADLQLPATGAVQVELTGLPAGVQTLPEGTALMLVQPDSPRRFRSQLGPGTQLMPTADGKFLHAHAAAGTAALWIVYADLNPGSLGETMGPLGYQLAEVEVDDRKTVDVVVDVAPVLPSTLEITVSRNGEQARDVVVELWHVGPRSEMPIAPGGGGNPTWPLVGVTGRSGTVTFDRVPKGDWIARARDRRFAWVTSSGDERHRIKAQSGTRVTATLDATTLEGSVQILDDASGNPLIETDVVFLYDATRHMDMKTDADGRVHLHLGPGTYEIRRSDGRMTGRRSRVAPCMVDWSAEGPQGPVRLR